MKSSCCRKKKDTNKKSTFVIANSKKNVYVCVWAMKIRCSCTTKNKKCKKIHRSDITYVVSRMKCVQEKKRKRKKKRDIIDAKR